MNNPYRSGTADVWYSGSQADMWIEYKFLAKPPVRSETILADLSPLQIKWLRGRYEDGRKVYVIIGCPTGGVILRDLDWENPLSVTKFRDQLITKSDLAKWIVANTVGEVYDQRIRHLYNS